MNHLLFGKQQSKANYGVANLIADLGTAILQRNQENATPGLISDALNGIYDSTNQVHDPSQDGTGLLPSMSANATQSGLLPSTNFQQSDDTADNIGSGLLNLQSPAPNFNNVTGQTMPAPSQGTQVLQRIPQQVQGFTPPQQQAPAQKQSIDAPPLTSQQAPQGVQLPSTAFSTQQTAPTANDIANPMATDDTAFHNNAVAISQPTTPEEAQRMITQSLLKAQGDLAAKGVPSSVSAPILMQAAQQKMADYQQQFKQQQMQGALATLNDPKADDRSAAMSAMQLSQLGIKIPSGFIQAYKNPALSHVVVNAGGQQVLKSFNPKTGQFTDGGSIDVTNTPYQTGQLSIGQQNADANTVKAQAAVTNANRPRGGGSGGSGGGRSSGGSSSGVNKYINSPQYVKDLGLNQQLYASQNGGATMFPSDEAKAQQAVARLQAAQQGQEPQDPQDDDQDQG